jgi:hypothetical protein
MSRIRRIESVGWGFFGLVLVVAIPAWIYVIFQATHDSLTLGTRVGAGVTLAFFFAAFTSWAVNSLLQYRSTPSDRDEPANRKPRKSK